MAGKHTLAASHIGVAVAAFGVASFMGVLQALSMADIAFPWRSESLYYMTLTAHGVLMALVFTTFFIMGLGYVLARECLGRIVGQAAGWLAFGLGTAGAAAAAVTILRGQSTVLYTFYPPLQAHPLFYIGATLIVVASWIWGAIIIASFRAWRREHRGEPIPLPIHGLLATIILWYLATTGLAIEVVGMLIPWSLGWVEKIDPMVAPGATSRPISDAPVISRSRAKRRTVTRMRHARPSPSRPHRLGRPRRLQSTRRRRRRTRASRSARSA